MEAELDSEFRSGKWIRIRATKSHFLIVPFESASPGKLDGVTSGRNSRTLMVRAYLPVATALVVR